MAQSRAKATIPEYNPYGSSQISSSSPTTSNRPAFNRPATIDLKKSKYKQTTYNENFPGLNESSYKKLEAAVDKLGLKGEEKQSAMNQWYRNNVKYLLNDQTLEERAKFINEQAYQAAETNNPEANAQLRMTEFSQALKKKYNLDATANDLDVFNDFVANLGEEGVNLAGQYLAGENKKLRYDAGLETGWEKAADFGVGVLQSPGKWGYNLYGQRFDRVGEWIGSGIANSLSEDEKESVIDWLDKNTIFKKDRINEYSQVLDQREAEGNKFKGRANTDITKPILGEERAKSGWTKGGEVVGDIATGIAMSAPLASALYPAMATQGATNAALLGGIEGGIDTLVTQLGTEGNLDITPMQSVLGIGAGMLGGLLTNKLANLPKNQQENIRKEASQYIEKSIKPTVKGKQNQAAYNKFIDDTLDVTDYMSKNKNLLQYTDDAGEIVKGQMPTNMRETSEALFNLKKHFYDQYNALAKQAGDAGAKVNLNKLYDSLDDLTKNIAVNQSNPGITNTINQYKDALLKYSDDAGNIAIQDAQETMQHYNKILDAYFKNPGAYANDSSKNIVVATLKRDLAKAVDDSMDDVLNKGINNGSKASEQYRYRKQLYSKVKTIEDEVSKRALVEARKNAKGLSSEVLDALAGKEVVEGLLTKSPTGLVKGATMKIINAYNKYLNNPNTQLKNLFELVEKTNNPTLLQTATSNLGNAVKSTVQKAAPLVSEAVVPGAIETLTNE